MDAEVTVVIMALVAIILIALIMAVMHISAKSDEMCKILTEINKNLTNRQTTENSSQPVESIQYESKKPNPPAATHGDWVCKSCGTKNKANSAYCGGCGEYK